MLSNNKANGRPFFQRLTRPIRINTEAVKRNIIVIGASAGGVMALSELFAALPAEMPASIGVVLHRSMSPGELASVLGRRSLLPVIEPKDHRPLKHGVIYLAPADHHLLFENGGIAVHRGPKEHGTRPAIDPLFRSAAAHYRQRVVGIVFTGAGEDGVSGLISISQKFGVTLTQDPDDAFMPYMPMNALRFDDVDGVYPLRDMAAVVTALVKGQPVATLPARPFLPLRWLQPEA